MDGTAKGTNASSDPVEVAIRSQDATAVVALSGELDDAAVPAVEEAILRAAAQPGVRRLRLDLAGLTFIDSSGMAMLIRLERRSQQDGFRFTVAEPSEAIRQRLDRTGLLTLLMDTHHLSDRSPRQPS